MMPTFNVNMFELSPVETNTPENPNLGVAGNALQAIDRAMKIVKEYTDQGWDCFTYGSGEMRAFLLVKADSALFKLVEVSNV